MFHNMPYSTFFIFQLSTGGGNGFVSFVSSLFHLLLGFDWEGHSDEEVPFASFHIEFLTETPVERAGINSSSKSGRQKRAAGPSFHLSSFVPAANFLRQVWRVLQAAISFDFQNSELELAA